MTKPPKDRDYDDERDEPTKPLDQDFDPPFSPPPDIKRSSSPFGPDKDTELDAQELYDEGEDAAATDSGPKGDRPAGDRPRKVF